LARNAARILSVAESYDSAVSARPHRAAISPEEALQVVRGGSGKLFDPEVAQFFAAEVPLN
jgi:HD-GYP domain-containing protein (c-di-GMP phosphodiesterase class II)